MQKFLPMAVLIGALFAMRMPCGATTPVQTTLYNFPGGNPATDVGGAFPEAGLVLNGGDLFGTTYAGGSGWGTVFVLEPPAVSGENWSYHQLYAFTGGADGANPRGNLIFSSHGLIFGTTEQGGAWGFGTVFTLTAAGGGKYTQAVVYSFTGTDGDGAYPEAGLVLNSKSGVFFGTTDGGGAAGYGTVFSLTPVTGGTWTEKPLWSFAGAPAGCGTASNPACDGANPVANLTFSPSGVLYGTTYGGGGPGWGTVFRLAQTAGVWAETVIYSFNGAPSSVDGGSACGTTGDPTPCDGGAPAGALVLNAASGALYGTTTVGGTPTGCPQGGYEQGCGVVFQLKPPVSPSTAWTESLIYTFAGPPQDGSMPSYSLALPTPSGGIYGTTFSGGASTAACFPVSYTGCGTVYLLRPPVAPSTAWTKSNLAVFDGDSGLGPNGLIFSPAGGLVYGTTYGGGLSGGYGTIFQVAF
jgi:uncharacterized repeat protein (TIGR03803 family)